MARVRDSFQQASRAYRRVPIRWRLAGGSAALTVVILMGFATIVGVLTTQRIRAGFNEELRASADELAGQVQLGFGADGRARPLSRINLQDYAAAQNALIRVGRTEEIFRGLDANTPFFGGTDFGRIESAFRGFRVETRPIPIRTFDGRLIRGGYLVYGRRLSEVEGDVRRLRVFLGFGVLGGAVLALLAGLATARRAMAPIRELTEAARRVERTGDASVEIPHPQARDEVAELAETLEGMLRSLGSARSETEAALARQREFVADASHELRTPLTSVLANLELLEETLGGEQREAAASALRSSRRMRRLVADLLLLARADAGRIARHEPLDLSLIVADAAGELEPVAGDHPLQVDAAPGAVVEGSRDELHRLVLNLMENALRHTDPGTAVEASLWLEDGTVVLAVEDDGPGIPPDLADRVFERFFRASSDRGGSSGLGLSIVRAVADSHGGTVQLEPPLDGRGARFVVRLPAAVPAPKPEAPSRA